MATRECAYGRSGAATECPLEGLLPGWLRDYERTWLVWDVIAGLIVWSVVVPQAVGT